MLTSRTFTKNIQIINLFLNTVGHNLIDLEKQLGLCSARICAQISCGARVFLDQLTCGRHDFFLGYYIS